MDKRQPALGRFSEPALLILSCLQSSPKNGQAIREELKQIHNAERPCLTTSRHSGLGMNA